MNNIFKLTATIILVMFFINSNSQTVEVVRDGGVEGQLKRMVLEEWDDFGPSGWHGWWFWLTHRGYKNGDDLRPYKVAGGPKTNELALTTVSADMTWRIKKETDEEEEIELLDYLSQQGGELDLPYKLFFKKEFELIWKEIDELAEMPDDLTQEVFDNLVPVKIYRNTFEEVFKDNVKQINKNMGELGERMLGYLNVLEDLQHWKKVIYKQRGKAMSKVNNDALILNIQNHNDEHVGSDDLEIRNRIITNIRF